MTRPFHPTDNGKAFSYRGQAGTLEYPLVDPGTAKPGEAIFWYARLQASGAGWAYVLPSDVDPEGWTAEGTPTERHTPGDVQLTPFTEPKETPAMRDEDKTRDLLIGELRSTRADREHLQRLIIRAAYAFDKLPFDHAERRAVLGELKKQADTARMAGIA